MKNFVALYSSLDETTRTSEKTKLMAEYFRAAESDDLNWTVALLTGKRPPRPVKTADLRNWSATLANIPDWLFEESYAVVGDLAETISLLIPAGEQGSEYRLSEIMSQIISTAGASIEVKKKWLLEHWANMNSAEIYIFNKLIAGSFRVGVSKQLVYNALSLAFEKDVKVIAHKLMGQWTPLTTDIRNLLDKDDDDRARPYPFYLASQLDQTPESLGDTGDWIIERKFDGIRAQLIKRHNEVNIWSRGEELMTDRFPEITSIASALPDGIVLDGEILPMKDNNILSFNELQKRIGRKNLTQKILSDVPVCLMCYDLLELDGNDLRELALNQRRNLLEKTIADLNIPVLKLSEKLQAENWGKAMEERRKSRQMGCEGLMLKHRDSVYETGRKRGKWWKWKTDPLTADMVMLYAQPGHGRRANLYTDYTFAIRDGDNLLPAAKAYSGLTDAEITEVDRWIRKNTIDKFGPVRSVKAELVFEIAFEGIGASPRHKSGIALRFPRILRWRKDKKAGEINTKDDLLQLINAFK